MAEKKRSINAEGLDAQQIAEFERQETLREDAAVMAWSWVCRR